MREIKIKMRPPPSFVGGPVSMGPKYDIDGLELQPGTFTTGEGINKETHLVDIDGIHTLNSDGIIVKTQNELVVASDTDPDTLYIITPSEITVSSPKIPKSSFPCKSGVFSSIRS